MQNYVVMFFSETQVTDVFCPWISHGIKHVKLFQTRSNRTLLISYNMPYKEKNIILPLQITVYQTDSASFILIKLVF